MMKGEEVKDLMTHYTAMRDAMFGNSIDDATPEEWNEAARKDRINPLKTEKSQYNASKSGAQREALGVPYFRQLPLEGLAAGATALEYGARKYADRNWEKGLPWQQMIDSLKRHIDDFERGKDYDDGPDGSGLPHICMIMAGALMLSSSVIRRIGEDDRMPKTSDEAFSAKDCAKWMQRELERAEELSQMRQEYKVGNKT